jgi:hypothetical protein
MLDGEERLQQIAVTSLPLVVLFAALDKNIFCILP